MHPIYIVLISVGSALLLLFVLYLFLIKTHSPRKEMKRYKGVRFAHRGLHGDKIAENSMSAFKAAVDAGFGIELDVRLSSDGVLVVFHDDTLERMVGIRKRVDELTVSELTALRLGNSDEGIPTFSEVLELVGGRVPLLVEIKEDRGNFAVSDATAKALMLYSGDYIVESFNPLTLGNVRKQLPMTPCGFLSCKHKPKSFVYFMLTNLLLNVTCRPDFIAYNLADSSNFFLRLVRTLFRAPTLAWTVRSEEEAKTAYDRGFDGIIFEGFIPETL